MLGCQRGGSLALNNMMYGISSGAGGASVGLGENGNIRLGEAVSSIFRVTCDIDWAI